jgi:hypothetical protein
VAPNALRQFMHGNMVQPSARGLETPTFVGREADAGSRKPQRSGRLV